MGKIRPYVPRPSRRLVICRNGHDTRIVGRQGKNRRCRKCMSDACRRQRTGCTAEKYRALYLAQGGVCAICLRRPRGKRQELQADHDHKTGVIRGLLCGPCNLGIGNAGESLEVLDAMADYLIRNKGTPKS